VRATTEDVSSYKITRRNVWHEAYYTLRMVLAGGTELWALDHDNLLAAVAAVVAAIYWLVRANNESLRP